MKKLLTYVGCVLLGMMIVFGAYALKETLSKPEENLTTGIETTSQTMNLEGFYNWCIENRAE